ncbi:MAG: DMT family transporter [Gammaproteobacteria bacterium]|nr:DMT family transporter [Gammaproteobacteria bacterium]
MLVVDTGMPMFAALNGGLAARLQNPMLAAVCALLAAIAVVVTSWILTEAVPRLQFDASMPVWFYFGGVFVATYIPGMARAAPRCGVGNVVALVSPGQLISTTLIDRLGWFGAAQFPIRLQRIAGLVLMTAGAFLAVRR